MGGEFDDALTVDGVGNVKSEKYVEPAYALLKLALESNYELGTDDILREFQIGIGQIFAHSLGDQMSDHPIVFPPSLRGPFLQRHTGPSLVVRRLPRGLLQVKEFGNGPFDGMTKEAEHPRLVIRREEHRGCEVEFARRDEVHVGLPLLDEETALLGLEDATVCGDVHVDDLSWIVIPGTEGDELALWALVFTKLGVNAHFVGDGGSHAPVEALDVCAAALGDVPKEGGIGFARGIVDVQQVVCVIAGNTDGSRFGAWWQECSELGLFGLHSIIETIIGAFCKLQLLVL
mmetsp:Transcript_25679/g.41734  ORF Transcript_25679/g.41734 Transcript_25679/m.41734 type:complete len:289 (+) Transcript_25679:369-1235(+)